MAMSATQGAAANAANAVLVMLQNGAGLDHDIALEWLAGAVLALAQAAGGNTPTITGGPGATVADGTAISFPQR